MPRPSTRSIVPHGAWPSPITPGMLTAGTIGLSAPGTDGTTRYWLESLASEGGRVHLVRQTGDGDPEPVSPPELNVRSGVHEYGGGAWAARDGAVVVSSLPDHRLYRLGGDGDSAVPITPEHTQFRYADLCLDPDRGRLIAVREDHRLPDTEPVNTLVALSLDGPNSAGGTVIVSGSDFVSSPALSADGRQLVWLAWHHPCMPWQGTELWKADIGVSGTLSRLSHVAGSARESIFQPRWAPNGDLVFVSDRSGWWNLYRAYPGRAEVTPLCPMNAEFGLPQWVFGMSTWDFAPNGDIIAAWTQDGVWSLGRIPAGGGAARRFDLPFDVLSGLQVQREDNEALVIAAGPMDPPEVIAVDLESGNYITLGRSTTLDLPDGALSTPEAISWPTPDGVTAHGFFYPPASAVAEAPPGERPPLIVLSHGGPTSATDASLSLETQFWTSRGFAVLDVNYGGSTGYGRAYRQRLDGRWGIVDVQDCIAGAEHLGAIGRVDRNRLVIKGGSAGGYTTLAALAFHNVFRAGISLFGVGDLESLARDTHKFESRYLDGLVGPWPEARAVYEARSPIHHTEGLNCAMLLLQGEDDRVVPPAQAREMADAVRGRGLPVALVVFEGEGHGFRREKTIHAALAAELSFHAQVLGFPHPADIPRLEITNLPS